jgi:hypothetical protein
MKSRDWTLPAAEWWLVIVVTTACTWWGMGPLAGLVVFAVFMAVIVVVNLLVGR